MKLTTKRLRNVIKEELESRKAPFEPHRSSSPRDSLAAMNAADDEREVDQAIALSAEEEAILAKLLPKLNITTNTEGDIIIPAEKVGPLKRALAMGPGRGEGPRDGYDDVLGKLKENHQRYRVPTKLTKTYLRKIIQEETDRVIFEEGGGQVAAVAEKILASDDFAAQAEKALQDPEVMKIIQAAAAKVGKTEAVQEAAGSQMDLGDVASVTAGGAGVATLPAVIAALPGAGGMLGSALGTTSLGVFASVTGIGALAGLGLALTAYYLQKNDPSF